MSNLFRGIYVSKLRRLFEDEKLELPKKLSWRKLLTQLMKKDWVVYAKKPFAGPEKLLDYLGRYMHKIAIGNERILSFDEKYVTFKWRDYADNNRSKIMKLPIEEFINLIK